MAPGPLLDSLTSSRTSNHSKLSNARSRPVIPVVPIIPRQLENRRRQNSRGDKGNSTKGGKNKDHVEWKGDTPPSVNGAVPPEEVLGEVDVDPSTTKPHKHDPKASYIRFPRHYDGAERFAFELPPSFYPGQASPGTTSPGIYTVSHEQAKTSSAPIHERSTSNSGIVFGGYLESAEPSPVLSPTVAPTFYPQPPLPVDTSQSMYHGYGHTHQLLEPTHGWPGYIQYPSTYDYPMQSPYDTRVPFVHPAEHHSSYPPSIPALSDRSQYQHFSNEHAATTPSVASHSSHELPPQAIGYPPEGKGSDAPYTGGEGIYTYPCSVIQDPLRAGAANLSESGVMGRPADKGVDGDEGSDLHRLSMLADYLLDQFNIPGFADCQLQITNESGTFETVELSLHSVLVAQNPVILDLLNSAKPGVDGRKFLRINMSDRFVTPTALQAALRVYYGGPVMSHGPFDSSEQNLVGQGRGELPHYHSATSSLDPGLAYAAAGCLLQMPEVAHWGIQMASRLLSWSTIEKAFSFALQGGLSPVGITECEIPLDTSASSDSSKEHSAIATPASSNEPHNELDLSHPEAISSPPPRGVGTYAPYADDLLHAVLCFLIQSFPPAFLLDVSAPPLAHIDRLPNVAKSSTTAPPTKSRLSAIQFGDYSAHDSATLDVQTTTTLSSILLSVPFIILTYLAGRLDESTKLELLKPVVEERERRRQRVLTSKSVPWTQRQAAPTSWEPVGWEEFVSSLKEGESAVGKVERRWVGFRNPDEGLKE